MSKILPGFGRVRKAVEAISAAEDLAFGIAKSIHETVNVPLRFVEAISPFAEAGLEKKENVFLMLLVLGGPLTWPLIPLYVMAEEKIWK